MGSESILLLILVTGITNLSNNPDASKKAQQAYIRYLGVNDAVSSYAKQLQKDVEKQAPQEVRFYLGPAIYVSKTILERKIVFKWTF